MILLLIAIYVREKRRKYEEDAEPKRRFDPCLNREMVGSIPDSPYFKSKLVLHFYRGIFNIRKKQLNWMKNGSVMSCDCCSFLQTHESEESTFKNERRDEKT